MATPRPEQVILGYQAAVQRVRKAIEEYALLAWGSSGYRDADVNRLVQLLVPKVQAGQLKVANLTASYIASIATLKAGRTVAAVPVDRALVLGARGIEAAEVYRRPAVTVYTALAAGKTFTEASTVGRERLRSIVGMDLQLSKTHQARRSLEPSGFSAFRRTLTGRENCAMCLIASTQRYFKEDLMPIHPGCDCGVEPLSEREAVSQVIDPELLEQTHNWVADFAGEADRGGRAPDYRQLIVAREHGEYGPTLSWRGQKFTGPDDVAA